MIPFVKTASGITIYASNKTYTVGATHPNFDKVLHLCLNSSQTDGFDLNELDSLCDIPAAILKYTEGLVKVEGENFFYNGYEVNNSLTQRILTLLQTKQPVGTLTNFLDNIMLNPSKSSVDELYGFLENSSLPITPDGHFLAYKKVNKDYLDIYSRTIDNKPGSIVEVQRNQVDDDRNRTCSHGLHCCAFGYLDEYRSGDVDDRILIVKVNPRDVVSVPSDYHDQKMRVCRYEVVGEIPNDSLFRLMDWVTNSDWTIERIRETITTIKELLKNYFGLTEEPKYHKILFAEGYALEEDESRMYSYDDDDDDDDDPEEQPTCDESSNAIAKEPDFTINTGSDADEILADLAHELDTLQICYEEMLLKSKPNRYPEISVRSIFQWASSAQVEKEKT